MDTKLKKEAFIGDKNAHTLVFGSLGSPKTGLFCLQMLDLFAKAGAQRLRFFVIRCGISPSAASIARRNPSGNRKDCRTRTSFVEKRRWVEKGESRRQKRNTCKTFPGFETFGGCESYIWVKPVEGCGFSIF